MNGEKLKIADITIGAGWARLRLEESTTGEFIDMHVHVDEPTALHMELRSVGAVKRAALHRAQIMLGLKIEELPKL